MFDFQRHTYTHLIGKYLLSEINVYCRTYRFKRQEICVEKSYCNFRFNVKKDRKLELCNELYDMVKDKMKEVCTCAQSVVVCSLNKTVKNICKSYNFRFRKNNLFKNVPL
jgi:lipopolysaccharide biosynthesis glycosyltransferase